MMAALHRLPGGILSPPRRCGTIDSAVRTFAIIPKPRHTIEEALTRLRSRTKDNDRAIFSVNFKLNLDWRVKSNRMHGTFEIPHGLGRRSKVAAYTYDDELKVQALIAGAEIAGDMEHRVRENGYNLAMLDRVVADTELEDIMKRPNKFRSSLKRQSLIACVEEKTLVSPDDFAETVYKHVHGIYRPYQTDHHGNITTAVGRASMEDWQIDENVAAVMMQLFEARPDCFGTGPSRKKQYIGIFLLKMHMTGALNMSVEIDLDSFPFLLKLNSSATIDREYQVVSEQTLRELQRSL
jgi:large subunit ribosomal protein L1